MENLIRKKQAFRSALQDESISVIALGKIIEPLIVRRTRKFSWIKSHAYRRVTPAKIYDIRKIMRMQRKILRRAIFFWSFIE
ncbi:MAG: hypothetical protein F6K22_14105 [Okeania sp. SIO2F4]|uniref:hypothetical protein n=1 Tax=Okeania sp. SIO2F4 TaxID=2607790 RepID=UPI00142B0967|nr:hypothetical protein [Okeania sp. SIO2F4]NES03874.1 hypothetical protein [Okeania sp. SIO2F4]